MSSVKSVIITLPKGVPKAVPRNEPSRSALSKLNFTTSILVDKVKMEGRKVDQQQQQQQQQEEMHDGGVDVAALLEPVVRGKKRRLDHLSWEEKLQRKKLKNRVAAQTSRDRKKARLDELEETVRMQKERNELLTQDCTMLRSQNDLLKSQNEWLLNENKRLRDERDAVRNTLTDQQQQPICSACRARVDGAVPSLGSAVSPNNPLPQGGTAQSASRPTRTPEVTVLLNFLTYFLLTNCLALSKVTTPSDSKSWRRASYEKLAQRLRQTLIDQMNKCPSTKLPLKNLTVQKHWWGRHQKMWKPIEPVEA
ncbi:X-box-binding protein 1 [Monomorium pharaonis]|uniref:X-box-binding protein 1 n=1 Tax=Monomorium pharaonis TaxID=307658 RepID=UPI00102E1903|nr:X-box-binding protein 1 [Monomorium pharaonis]